MSKRYLIAAAICALTAAGLAQAQTAPPAAPAAPATPLETVIKARQAAYLLSAGDLGAMSAAANGGADVTKLTFSAGGLARWARTIPSLFPAGTGEGQTSVPSEARAEIWSDRAGFEAAAAVYATETGKLRDLAKAGDKAGFIAQIDVVKASCTSCHDKYRHEAKRG